MKCTESAQEHFNAKLTESITLTVAISVQVTTSEPLGSIRVKQPANGALRCNLRPLPFVNTNNASL